MESPKHEIGEIRRYTPGSSQLNKFKEKSIQIGRSMPSKYAKF